MIPMMDTSEDLDLVEFEIGCSCEELLTPLTRRTRKRPNGMFAIDNGSYSRFRLDAFVSLLEREKNQLNFADLLQSQMLLVVRAGHLKCLIDG